MAKRKRYDDQFRASAVLMLEAAGYPDKEGALSMVWKKLGGTNGPSKRTLRRWWKGTSNPPPDKLVQQIKTEFVDQLSIIKDMTANQIIERLQEDEFENRELVGLMKIAAELGQLLTGQPTERTEQMGGITIEYRDENGLKLNRPEWMDDAERLMQ